jgi:hypothetical protein
MRKEQIKEGHWYETKVGIGRVIKAGGCHPWAAQVNIVGPFPRGTMWVTPKDFVQEHTEIAGQIERALRRFPMLEPIDSTTPPAQDLDMMAACDLARYVVGHPLPGTDHGKKWRWSLTIEGRAAWSALQKTTPKPMSEVSAGIDSSTRSSRDQSHWHAMYLGAFAALLIPNAEMALDMAKVTRSDQECIDAIRILRTSKEGDRVWPALEHLRVLREGEKAASPS